MTHSPQRLAAVLALCLPTLALAQRTPDAPSMPKPAASAPALRYESAFAHYKPYRDLEPGDWRALNDALGATAPHMGHAGHGAMAAPPAPVAPASAPPQHQLKHHHPGGTK